MNTGKSLIFIAGLLFCAMGPLKATGAELGNCTAAPRVTGQQGAAIVTSAEHENFDELYAEAECLRNLAAMNGAEWLKTEEILLLSKQEAEKGNREDALQLLQTARFQAEAALRQAETEATAWQHRVIGYRETDR